MRGSARVYCGLLLPVKDSLAPGLLEANTFFLRYAGGAPGISPNLFLVVMISKHYPNTTKQDCFTNGSEAISTIRCSVSVSVTGSPD